MKLKTSQPVTIAQARIFEDQQGIKGIKKEGIFSQEDCHWELNVGKPAMKNGFETKVEWFQIQNYETGDPENPTAEMPVLMFSEDFKLTVQELDDLFNAVNIPIVPPDSLAQKFDEIVLAGILYWVGTVRQIFGLDASGFEVLEASRPAPENSEIQKELDISEEDIQDAENFTEKISGFKNVIERPEGKKKK